MFVEVYSQWPLDLCFVWQDMTFSHFNAHRIIVTAKLLLIQLTIIMLLPTDKLISIDLVIQQLQELTPHWRAVGQAADIQPTVLNDVSV